MFFLNKHVKFSWKEKDSFDRKNGFNLKNKLFWSADWNKVFI
jgi:hypothetical protein